MYKIYCDGEVIYEFKTEREGGYWLEQVKIRFPQGKFTKEV